MTEESRAYSKGYQAGRKRADRDQYAANIRNDRLTQLTQAIMAAAMAGSWGTTVDGKHRNYNLIELENMAIRSATRLVNKMKVYEK